MEQVSEQSYLAAKVTLDVIRQEALLYRQEVPKLLAKIKEQEAEILKLKKEIAESADNKKPANNPNKRKTKTLGDAEPITIAKTDDKS